jgi:predicted ester cyclase
MEDMIAEKGEVVVSWLISGTHKSEFMDITATGRRVSVGSYDSPHQEWENY